MKRAIYLAVLFTVSIGNAAPFVEEAHFDRKGIWEKVFGESKKKRKKRLEERARLEREALQKKINELPDFRYVDRNSADPMIAATESDSNAYVEGVNVITGEYIVAEQDYVVQGAETLALPRLYISGDGGAGSGWFIDPPHLKLKTHHFSLFNPNLPAQHPENILYNDNYVELTRQNGTCLFFRAPVSILKSLYEGHRRQDVQWQADTRAALSLSTIRFDPPDFDVEAVGAVNTAKGTISARTNLKNLRVESDFDMKEIQVYETDGTVRTYKRAEPHKPWDASLQFWHTTVGYDLVREALPNGCTLVYNYTGEPKRLYTILLNGADGQTIAWARYDAPSEGTGCDIRTSDRRVLRYRSVGMNGATYLTEAESPTGPKETIHYWDSTEFRGPLVKHRSLPDGRFLYLEYYTPGQNDLFGSFLEVEAGSPIVNRVKCLVEPKGSGEGENVVTHRFIYFPAKAGVSDGFTEVHEPDGKKTIYRISSAMRLEAIERYIVDGADFQLVSSERLIWGGEANCNLLSRTLYDPSNSPITETRYVYDAAGNVLEELNLGTELQIKRYRYTADGRHLRESEEGSDGRRVATTYLSNMEKVVSIIVSIHGEVKERKFYEYQNGFLVKSTKDNGSGLEAEDLTGVTRRKVKEIRLRDKRPYLNMPDEIEEKIWEDGKLVSHTTCTLSYTEHGQIEAKEIADQLTKKSRRLSYDYDTKGRVTESTDSAGEKENFAYDHNGNLLLHTHCGGLKTEIFEYDLANRLVLKREIGDGEEVSLKRYRYDFRGNCILEIDSEGRETHYVYDAFSNLIEIRRPPVCNEEGEESVPVERFS